MSRRRDLRCVPVLSALIVLLTAPASAAVLVVASEGGDFTDIQPAVAAAADGDTILVRPGTYSPFTVSGLDRLHIVGAGWNEPRDLGSRACGADVPPASFLPPVVVDGSASPAGTSCAVIASAAAVSITGFTLRDCPLYGVSIVNSYDVALIANRIEGAAGPGVRLVASADSEVTCNLIGFNGSDGIVLDGATGTTIADNGIGFNGAHGIAVIEGTGYDNWLVNNQVRRNTQDCIVASGDALRIERNTCDRNRGRQEIFVDESAVDADLIGNLCVGGAIVDLGVATELRDNACP